MTAGASWPTAATATRWAASWPMDDVAVVAPPELRGLTGDTYRREAARLKSAGVPGADGNVRVSAGTLSAVLGAICGFYGIDGPWAWADADTIAGKVGRSRRTVVRAVRRLDEAGFLAQRKWFDPATGHRLPNRYYLPLLCDFPVPDGPVAAVRDIDYRPNGRVVRAWRPVDSPPTPTTAADRRRAGGPSR